VQAAYGKSAATTRPWRQFTHLLSCIRFDEVLILQGTPLLGALFSMGRLTRAGAAAVGLLIAGSICLVAHVFVLNDWSGMSADLRDPNRTSRVFINRGVARARIGHLSIALLALSLLLLGSLSWRTLTIAMVIAGLSALYSAPAAHIKGVPVLNSALHFAGGLLHFLLGYSVFRAPDGRGIAVGCFLALVFTAGHLTHETRDSESDRLNGITTNAVRFGKERNFVSGLVLFTMADILLAVLAFERIAPLPLVVIAALYLLHVYWSWQTMRAGLTFDSVRRLQVRYRFRYAAIGLIMALRAIQITSA
jgi:4-hydroxybenzoate polyprenyltransferase